MYNQKLAKLHFAPKGLRILAGGDNHRKRVHQRSQAPAGATDQRLSIAYLLSCAPPGREHLVAVIPVVVTTG